MLPDASERQALIRLALTTPAGWLAIGFGSGLSPIAPGTAGSLMALLLAWLLLQLQAWLQWPLAISVAASMALVFVLGVWAANRISSQLQRHDHSAIVVDEFIGQWLVLLVVPVSVSHWLLAFLLFRLFDIIKPWPIGYADRHVHGGFGVMLDDVLAAIYAMMVWLLWEYVRQ